MRLSFSQTAYYSLSKFNLKYILRLDYPMYRGKHSYRPDMFHTGFL